MSIGLAERTQLTYKMIAIEALRTLTARLEGKRSTFHEGLPPDFGKVLCSQVIVGHGALSLSLDSFSESFVKPTIQQLAHRIASLGDKLIFGRLELPSAYSCAEMAIDSFIGVGLRTIYAYDINTDRFTMRFDVLCAAIKGAQANV